MFNFFKKEVKVYSPLNGKVISIEEVPDPVFSQRMVGDGFAVRPELGVQDVLAPVSGTIAMIFPTSHAFGITMDNGFEVLVHLGIDTVELNGEGFTQIAKVGDKVTQGDLILRMDVNRIEELGKDPVTPVVFTAKDMSTGVETIVGHSECGLAAKVKLA